MKSKHEATIQTIAADMAERLGDKQYRHPRLVLSEARKLSQAIGGLNAMNQRRSPTETESAHFKKISAHAKSLEIAVAQAEQRIHQHQREHSQELEGRTNQRLGLSENAYAAELRSTLRAMNEKDRSITINELIASGDGAAVAAITKAPPVLTGVTPELQGKYIEQFTKQQAPDLLDEQEALIGAMANAASILGAAKRAANDYSDPARLQAIEEAERSALEAEGQFKASFSDNA
jgi:hypothetical protein